MQAAWLTFAAAGRREHPDLRVVFAMLAGWGAAAERAAAEPRRPERRPARPEQFYETSSYGPAAVEMMARRVGAGQLLYGSDRPVVEPAPTGRERELQANAAELLADGR